MTIPLQISFRGIEKSEAVESRVREKAKKLDRFYPHIISCRVAIEAEHHHHHQGNQYHIRIELSTPGKELVISREHHDKQALTDIYVAIRDAFNAATRQLEDYAQIQRGQVKSHTQSFTPQLADIWPDLSVPD
jgi:ribosomal subunit interface protein